MRNAKMPFVDEGHCITRAQQSFLNIHGSIPCNLAPAHFTVHIAYAIKLRSRETLIKSLSDLILGFLYRARRHSTRIASYLRRMSTTLCIKIHMKSDSVI